MRTRLTVPALLVVLLLGLAACGSGGDDPPAGAAGGNDAAATPAQADTTADQDGEAASGDGAGAASGTWAFTATTLDGEDFDAQTLAGTPTVLWFWAPWCPTCRGQASTVADVAERYAGKVNVIGVAGLDDSTDAMREFVEATGTGGFPHLADAPGAVWQRFEITQQSVYVLVDASGAVVHSGFLDNDQLPEQVGQLAA